MARLLVSEKWVYLSELCFELNIKVALTYLLKLLLKLQKLLHIAILDILMIIR